MMGTDVLEQLLSKVGQVVPQRGNWRVTCLGFARGGWTAEALAFARGRGTIKMKGDNWQLEGMQLIDLTQVDADLVRWTS